MKPEKHITPAKLADDHGYRVAAEAFIVVMGEDCPQSIREKIEAVVLKEAARVGGKH